MSLQRRITVTADSTAVTLGDGSNVDRHIAIDSGEYGMTRWARFGGLNSRVHEFDDSGGAVLIQNTGGTLDILTSNPVGSGAPVYDPALHTSLFFDDFSGYTSIADMEAGDWDFTSPGSASTGWRFQNNGDATNYFGGDFGSSGEITREMTPSVDVLAGTNPSELIWHVRFRNVNTTGGAPNTGYVGKIFVIKGGGTPLMTGRWVGLITSNQGFSDDERDLYWDIVNHAGNTYPAESPIGTSPVATYTRTAFRVNRDGITCNALANHQYTQNEGYVLQARPDQGSTSCDPYYFWANYADWIDMVWRFTKSNGGTGGCGDGTGKVESWLGVIGVSMVKVIDFQGDSTERPEGGSTHAEVSGGPYSPWVHCPSVASSSESVIGQPYLFGPSKFDWVPGGSNWIDVDRVRFYVVT